MTESITGSPTSVAPVDQLSPVGDLKCLDGTRPSDLARPIKQNLVGPAGEAFTQGAYALVDLVARYDYDRQPSATLKGSHLPGKKYYCTGLAGLYGDLRDAMLNNAIQLLPQ